ncbi:MAG TPA: patatin family protein [Methanocorpusculum sp.]|nr:patatin family protein [Methanocorpusculum sp.]
MYSAGLIFEGGGMRGAYTAGVIDAFIDNKMEFTSCYGVSSGACHGASYLSKQHGRAYRTMTDYIGDKRYLSYWNLLTKGDLVGPDMVFHIIPEQLDPFDYDEYNRYPGKFYCVATNCETGEAEYLHLKIMQEDVEMIHASSSLPILAKKVKIGDNYYFDGGIADSIPIEHSIADGNAKNVLVLTQAAGYQKKPDKTVPILKIAYHKYPKMVEMVATRHIRYNHALEIVAKEEKAGRAFVICPKKPVTVSRMDFNMERIVPLYEDGYRDTMEKMNDLISFLEK